MYDEPDLSCNKSVIKLPASARALNTVHMLHVETCFNILARENKLQKEKNTREKCRPIITTYFLCADFQ